MLGGESFVAIGKGLQNALWTFGAPQGSGVDIALAAAEKSRRYFEKPFTILDIPFTTPLIN
jgi:hypothetical protein